MIKKIIIKTILGLMIFALLSVVVVEWLWIKSTIDEKKDRFSIKVYGAMEKAINHIDEVNYIKYLWEMQQRLGQIQEYNNQLSSVTGVNNDAWNSTYLSNFITDDMGRLLEAQSYVNANNHPRSERGKAINKHFIMETIQSINPNPETPNKELYKKINQIMKDFMIRVLKERDPQNVSINSRLRNIDIKTILDEFLRHYNIDLPYTFDILSKENIIQKQKNEKANNFYYMELFPLDYVKKDLYLAVQFSSIMPSILENMGWMFIATGFCVIGLICVFIISISIIMRQQKLSLIKNDFINNMTHEFKTPLATIALATSALTKEKVINDKQQITNFNNIIKSENERMNKYVERILQQAKMDKGEIHLNRTEVSIDEIVKESVKLFTLQVQNAGGCITGRYETEGYSIYADEVHILNAICNLIDNAIKYSDKSPEIEVFSEKSKNGKEIVIGVKDHGIGISKESQKKVFKRFYRVSTGNLHNVKGFGLGLSYVKNIIEIHGGNVELTSQKGKGTLVKIIFNIE